LKKSLFIVSKAPAQEGVSLLPSTPGSQENASVVLIQEGVRYQKLPLPYVFALSDDVLSRKLNSPFPSVSYQRLVGMIFEADSVAVL
jgi:sulfur transfer complex TusBCD TusB component (DsrH family)